jgi:hypothetical protein
VLGHDIRELDFLGDPFDLVEIIFDSLSDKVVMSTNMARFLGEFVAIGHCNCSAVIHTKDCRRV